MSNNYSSTESQVQSQQNKLKTFAVAKLLQLWEKSVTTGSKKHIVKPVSLIYSTGYGSSQLVWIVIFNYKS